jgi:hypothetical protein
VPWRGGHGVPGQQRFLQALDLPCFFGPRLA